MVSDLIDADRRCWDTAKVRSTFLPHEAELVLGIPISYRLPDDSVIWAWTSNGKFSVRSAYGVAQSCLKEGPTRSDLGSCSDNTKMKAIWKMVWRLDCPNKIKHFMWRACKNILPTRNRLKGKGISCEDCCALCGCSETSGHILWDCKLAKEVWCGTKIKLPALPEPVPEFLNLVWEAMDSHPNTNWVLFAVTAWSLWNNRNTVIHGGLSKGQEGLIKSVAAYIDETKGEKTSQRRAHQSAAQLWNPPKQGWYKVNTDGAVFRETGSYGIGVVVRNEKGQIMGALCRRLEMLLGVLEVEAKAVEEGVQFARDLSLGRIVIECDSQAMVNSFCKQGPMQSNIQKVIEGTRLGLRCFDAREVAHTRRGSNSAAHIMARYAKFVNECDIWVEDTPPMIVNQVLNDVSRMAPISV